MSNDRHIVLIGPSGSGKSTLVKRLIEKNPSLVWIKTYTTRSKRSDEDDSHEFISEAAFQDLKDKNVFIGTLNAFDAQYGLPSLPEASRCILLLRAPVIKLFKETYPKSIVIEVDAPLHILKQRLSDRRSIDRIDDESLLQEIKLGSTLADAHVDTSQSIDDCTRQLMALVHR